MRLILGRLPLFWRILIPTQITVATIALAGLLIVYAWASSPRGHGAQVALLASAQTLAREIDLSMSEDPAGRINTAVIDETDVLGSFRYAFVLNSQDEIVYRHGYSDPAVPGAIVAAQPNGAGGASTASPDDAVVAPVDLPFGSAFDAGCRSSRRLRAARWRASDLGGRHPASLVLGVFLFLGASALGAGIFFLLVTRSLVRPLRGFSMPPRR